MNSSGSAGATPISTISSPRVEQLAVVARTRTKKACCLGTRRRRRRRRNRRRSRLSMAWRRSRAELRRRSARTPPTASPVSSVRRSISIRPAHRELAPLRIARQGARADQADAVGLAQEAVDALRVQGVGERGGTRSARSTMLAATSLAGPDWMPRRSRLRAMMPAASALGGSARGPAVERAARRAGSARVVGRGTSRVEPRAPASSLAAASGRAARRAAR